jgi:hypothetical protein
MEPLPNRACAQWLAARPQNITNGIDRHLRPSRIVQSEAGRSIHFDFEILAGNKFVNIINPK